MLTTGTYSLQMETVTFILSCGLLIFLFLLLILSVIKSAQDKDQEQEYLKTLTDEERLIIAKYNDNKKTKWFKKKTKGQINNMANAIIILLVFFIVSNIIKDIENKKK